jgi:YhcH/YjgK/YiaL family protein
MILDRLDRLPAYAAINRFIAPAHAWLTGQDLSRLADGRIAIQGEDLFAIVESRPSRDTGRFETHRTYADIQVNLAGGERMGWWPGEGLAVTETKGPDTFFHQLDAATTPVVEVPPGHFAIFAPGEAHLPLLHPATGPVQLRKVVLKLRW